MKIISPDSLIDMGAMSAPLKIDLVYADAHHPFNTTFQTALYKPDAKLWLHKDLASVVILAAEKAASQGLQMVLADGLRPIEAQAAMGQTPKVLAHPHWTMEGPNMLISKPGTGAHPRGMAVDIWLEDANGVRLDMGTDFDYFTENAADNPAARGYAHLSRTAKANRALLDGFMQEAADACGFELFMLPSEWWDYRAPAHVYEQYAPISDADLPADKKMCS